jgi:hypothetical protein
VVEQHELAVVLAHLVLGQGSFTCIQSVVMHYESIGSWGHTQVGESGRLPDGSCAARILCSRH